MSQYYYEVPEKPIRIYWDTQPIIRCSQCNQKISYKSWTTDKSESEQETEQIDDYTKKVTNVRVKRKVTKTNVLNNDITCYYCGKGTLEFVGWPVWVVNAEKREITDLGALRMETESGELEEHRTETIKERKNLVEELYEKYRGD